MGDHGAHAPRMTETRKPTRGGASLLDEAVRWPWVEVSGLERWAASTEGRWAWDGLSERKRRERGGTGQKGEGEAQGRD
jgi:hypothetical protein